MMFPSHAFNPRWMTSTITVVLIVLCVGCGGAKRENVTVGSMKAIDLSEGVVATNITGPVRLIGARNEWLSTTLHVNSWRGGRGARLRVVTIDNAAQIPAESFSVYQVVSVPVDPNRAAFVRQTGQTSTGTDAPRALLPISMVDGEFDLSQLRDPDSAIGGAGRVADGSKPVQLWIDLHIPPTTPGGSYNLAIDLLERPRGKPVASLPVLLDVYDFVLPDQRHLDLVAQLNFSSLTTHYADAFANVSPRLINRTDSRYLRPVRTLDKLIHLTQSHRTSLFVPEIQPTVKWPSGEAPNFDWNDFDSLVTPWLTGEGFADRVPLGFWPVPGSEYSTKLDRRWEIQYWAAAASHFEQKDWLTRAAAVLEPTSTARVNAADSVRLSTQAATILAANGRLRVVLPLEQDQVQFATPSTFNQLPLTDMGRRMTVAAPGAVYAPPIQSWPRGVEAPQSWLRTDVAGLVPSIGSGGGERDVRAWAWLAFLRQSKLILWNDPLPTDANPRKLADPNDLVWFYPGEWFGRSEPVPSVALKWLRHAQQDFEYLYLAEQRGEQINTRLLAQLITKPVQVQPNQSPDPVYTLLGGTTDPSAWEGAMEIVARSILLRTPGKLPDLEVQHQLYLETLRWLEPQQRPILVGRTTQWLLDTLSTGGSNWVDLRCGIDIYNTGAESPTTNNLKWTGIGAGWRVSPKLVAVPALAPHTIRRATLEARVNLDELGQGTREPLTASLVLGTSGRQTELQLVVPAAAVEPRDERIAIDGSLADWREADEIATGPLVKMFDRPTLQKQELARMSTSTHLYANWTNDSLFLAFRLLGVDVEPGRAARNFVDYELRRAWGEDVCEVLVQPVYADNSVGPVFNVTCKPNGTTWVERKTDPRLNLDPWMPVEGTRVQYAGSVDDARIWRGELSIPWTAISETGKGRPVLLRFNFSAHNPTTGESGSWAGPVDFGRDENFMGLLHVRDRTR